MNQFLYSNRNYVLRKVLNAQENADIIKDLIEGILEMKILRILVNPYVIQNEKYLPKEENFGVVDVRIKTEKQEEYNVGIQFVDGKHIQTKIALYYLYIHSNQLYYHDDRKISKTITINFLDFPYQYLNENYHKVAILNKFRNIDFKEAEAEAHIIELPRFRVLEPKKMIKAEQWIAYIQGANQVLMDRAMKENKYIQRLHQMIQSYWEQEKI